MIGMLDLGQGMFGSPDILEDLSAGGMQFYQPRIDTNRVRAPVITIGATITMASTTPGATIYYTVDGSTPDATDTEYTGVIALPAETTAYKAIAILAEMDDSAVRVAVYTVEGHEVTMGGETVTMGGETVTMGA